MRILFLVCSAMMIYSGTTFSEPFVPRGVLGPDFCKDQVPYLAQPIFPRHTELPHTGCSVSLSFHVLPNGKVGSPVDSEHVDLDKLRKVASIKPDHCSYNYVTSVIRALRHAQFAPSGVGFECTYTYNFLPEY